MNAYYLPGEQLGWIPSSLAGLLASASVYKSSFGKKWNETFHQSCFKRDVRFFLLGFINTPTSCLLISIQFNATNRPTELRCLSLLILYSLLNRLIRRNNGFGEQASYGDELIAFFCSELWTLRFCIPFLCSQMERNEDSNSNGIHSESRVELQPKPDR